MLPLIPFAQLPRKDFDKRHEKKERLVWHDGADFQTRKAPPPPAPVMEDESSDDEYDLLEHLNSLLPQVKDGKLIKPVNDIILQDMRYKPSDKAVVTAAIGSTIGYVKGWRARERERRKHYIIKELEERAKKFNEQYEKSVLDQIDADERAFKLEEYRREQRIIHNSRKRKKKTDLAANFAKDIGMRDKQAAQMAYFCENLPVWKIEGQHRTENDTLRKAQERMEAQLKVKEIQDRVSKARHMQDDRNLLAEDEQLTNQVETMMLRYGTMSIKPKKSEHDAIESIFSNARQAKLEELSSSVGFQDDDDDDDLTLSTRAATRLDLHLRDDIDLLAVTKTLRKDKFKRDKRGAFVNPFLADFSATADVEELRGHEIQEVGAMSLAIEISRGACATLKTLDLRQCATRDNGFQRVVQAMKMSNLTTICVLDVRGNFLTVHAITYMKEIATYGIFQSLDTLLLGRNELGDAGVEALLPLLFQTLLPLIRIISVPWNSITDKGFRAVITALAAVQESLAPNLERLVLSNNLVTGDLRRRMSPLPPFVCI